MVLSFLSSITINQFNSWSIMEENRKKFRCHRMEFRTESLDCSNRIKSKTAFCIFVRSNWTVCFFGRGTNIWAGNIFFEESHMTRITYDKKRMHEAPDPYASSTRRNKWGNKHNIRECNTSKTIQHLLIVISYQWWYFRMPHGEIAEARRRYSSSLYSFHLLSFYRSFDYINIDTCALYHYY